MPGTVIRRRAGTRTDLSRAGIEPVDDDFDIRPYVEGIAAILAGTANVIMQLSWPAVGYGVLESPVDSGKITKHPLKRFRTTFTYLSVAALGNQQDRNHYREAVNAVHRQVRSGADSPVEYNALDPNLQLWVAACLYWGFIDVYTRMHGPLDDATADRLYTYSARFGTTLQVRPEMWPADRAAFDRYWNASLAKVSIDDTMRRYLRGLMTLEYLPRIVRILRGRSSAWTTTGFLPPTIREQMLLTWTERDERRFARFLRSIGAASTLLPGPARRFPFNYFLWDTRRRVRTGRPLV